MRFRLYRFALLALATVPIVMLACGEDSPDIPNVSELPDATIDTGGFDPNDAAPEADPCQPPVHPDDAIGVYVSTAGSSDQDCGKRENSCKTIAAGLARAKALNLDTVFIAQGEYDERVKLAAGKKLVGGWLVDGASNMWTKACGDNASKIVTIRAPNSDNITIDAVDLNGPEAKIADLHVVSHPGQAGPGESLYGVFAVGSTTILAIDNVIVDVGNAGDGKDGRSGDAGAEGGAGCIGAATGDGGPGAGGGSGGGGAAGAFDPNGYATTNGTDGTNGTNGQGGTAGGDKTCVDCGSCAIVALCGFTTNGTQSCGTVGQGGCAGGGGGAGGAATGGGTAIGVYSYNAKVTVNGGKFTAGNGGNGGNGGSGAAGGKGAPGAKGSNGGDCTTTCNTINDPINCTPVMTHGDGGAAGGTGGAGGAGGSGGGGSGGWSVGVFQGGTGVVTYSGGSFKAGKAGKGGGPADGGGANGTAADRYP